MHGAVAPVVVVVVVAPVVCAPSSGIPSLSISGSAIVASLSTDAAATAADDEHEGAVAQSLGRGWAARKRHAIQESPSSATPVAVDAPRGAEIGQRVARS